MKDQVRKILLNLLTREREIQPKLPEIARMNPEQAVWDGLLLHLEMAREEDNPKEIEDLQLALEMFKEILIEEAQQKKSGPSSQLNVKM